MKGESGLMNSYSHWEMIETKINESPDSFVVRMRLRGRRTPENSEVFAVNLGLSKDPADGAYSLTCETRGETSNLVLFAAEPVLSPCPNMEIIYDLLDDNFDWLKRNNHPEESVLWATI